VTRISVDTGQLSAAVGRAQTLQRDTEQCARGVASVRRALDLQIAASQQIDTRLGGLTARLDAQAGSLGVHAGFLVHASTRYEAAETAVCAVTPRQATAAGGLNAATIPPESGSLDDGGVRPAAWNDLIRAYGEELIGADKDVQEALVDLVGAVPFLGTLLTVDEITANVQNNHPGASAWDTFTMVATEGAEKGFGLPGLGSLISLLQSAAHLASSDQLQYAILNGGLPAWVPYIPALDMSQELDWVVSAGSDVVTAVSDLSSGIASTVGGLSDQVGQAWDWVTPW